jgi:hypothetical protein
MSQSEVRLVVPRWPDALVNLATCQGTQNFVRGLTDDTAQFLTRQGSIAVCQEYAKDRVNQ